MSTLRESLTYEPQVLRFGTSGRRGEVIHLTQLEIYINSLAELEYLLSLPTEAGGIRAGDEFYFAYDLRPSSTRFVPEQGGRGEIAQAIEQAIRDAGLRPVNLGQVPTPALTFYALQHGKGSMMITGSHIPFERNGYKTNSAKGELLKKDEAPINGRVEQVRHRLYSQPASESIFESTGNLKGGSRKLSPVRAEAAELYVQRYTRFFGPATLAGMRLLAYQHSAVGRDLLVDILRRLGAEVIPAGRSETFVPIDTEAIDAPQLATIQRLVDEAAGHGQLDAVVSTDGDSDRPLILGIDPVDGKAKASFYGGDLVGMVVAEFLEADAVVVPISCNDAVDRGRLKVIVEPKTRIGSPHVIAGMDAARAKGRQRVCGWEANGGFLTASDFTRNGHVLSALPTRDAILPILGVLASAAAAKLPVSGVFARLPRRFSKAALLRNFPRATSQKIIARLTPPDARVIDAMFMGVEIRLQDAHANVIEGSPDLLEALRQIRGTLSSFFRAADGFGDVLRINYTDGVRVYFSTGAVAHVRPSGNADELRIYAVADSQARANEIAAMGVAEPDGILRRLEKSVA